MTDETKAEIAGVKYVALAEIGGCEGRVAEGDAALCKALPHCSACFRDDDMDIIRVKREKKSD
jgi:hypothetical protein